MRSEPYRTRRAARAFRRQVIRPSMPATPPMLPLISYAVLPWPARHDRPVVIEKDIRLPRPRLLFRQTAPSNCDYRS